MGFWWVDHKQTRDHEVRGGYLWSPMRNANGSRKQSNAPPSARVMEAAPVGRLR